MKKTRSKKTRATVPLNGQNNLNLWHTPLHLVTGAVVGTDGVAAHVLAPAILSGTLVLCKRKDVSVSQLFFWGGGGGGRGCLSVSISPGESIWDTICGCIKDSGGPPGHFLFIFYPFSPTGGFFF
jgi:hypothetical protein